MGLNLFVYKMYRCDEKCGSLKRSAVLVVSCFDLVSGLGGNIDYLYEEVHVGKHILKDKTELFICLTDL